MVGNTEDRFSRDTFHLLEPCRDEIWPRDDRPSAAKTGLLSFSDFIES